MFGTQYKTRSPDKFVFNFVPKSFLNFSFVSLLVIFRKLLSITVKYPHPRSKLSFAPPQAICEQIVQRGETLEIFAPVKIIML